MGTTVKTRFEIASAVIKSELKKPYEYGKSDCFFLGCQIADAFEPSREMVKKYVGSYTTLLGAQRALKKRKFKSLSDLFGKHLDSCAPAAAQYGDIVILSLEGIEHVAICVGDLFLTRTENGREFHPLNRVSAAFRT